MAGGLDATESDAKPGVEHLRKPWMDHLGTTQYDTKEQRYAASGTGSLSVLTQNVAVCMMK